MRDTEVIEDFEIVGLEESLQESSLLESNSYEEAVKVRFKLQSSEL